MCEDMPWGIMQGIPYATVAFPTVFILLLMGAHYFDDVTTYSKAETTETKVSTAGKDGGQVSSSKSKSGSSGGGGGSGGGSGGGGGGGKSL